MTDIKPLQPPENTPCPSDKKKEWLWYIPVLLWTAVLLASLWIPSQGTQWIPYSEFLSNLENNRIREVKVSQGKISGQFIEPKSGKPRQFTTVPVESELARELSKHKVKFSGQIEDNFWANVLSWVLPIVFFLWFTSFMFQRLSPGGQSPFSGGFLPIEKSRARIYVEQDIKVTFADVAGVDEAIEELKEVVTFLKQPDRYRRLGGRLPKGILLVGPPGTGKTLLARAVAGEAKVSFFSISGSEFVEMFVGVGAARVRDLFAQAEKNAPCIIFIDELDALGKARGIGGFTGTHDEKEQTLNQLLVELDGFDPRHGVVLLAATNRPEVLDPALLRSGRFDRHIAIDRPDKKGRRQILDVHLKLVATDSSVDREELAALTPGFTGADLANMVNEAVLLAARRDALAVCSEDFNAAIERMLAGLEKKNRIINPSERKIVAYHELGHALVAMSLPGVDPVQKISIIPRGIAALGYTLQRPTEDRFLMGKSELENKMTVLMGGRAAEAIIFKDVSTGCADDLAKATDIARSMVTRYGMSEKLGFATYEKDRQLFLQTSGDVTEYQHFSEETAREIDRAVRSFLDEAFNRAKELLEARRQILEDGAKILLANETMSREKLSSLLSKQDSAARMGIQKTASSAA